MSLEDDDIKPLESYDLGNKIFPLPPGKANLIDGQYHMNHSKYSMYYYVEYIPPHVTGVKGEQPRLDSPEMVVVHWIPKSRADEVAPVSYEGN